MIAFPTAVLDMFEGEGLHLGDMLGQPVYHVKGVEEMLKTKHITFTKPYKDDYGVWLTVLYPIQDKNGEIFSYMGMDFDASLIMTWSNGFAEIYGPLTYCNSDRYFVVPIFHDPENLRSCEGSYVRTG
ncbi:hypothetical protein RE628_29240 [Paenibacillus sp. D2_2]|uniref:hypothetical protein n=1 Tax=Paenibacillus sp. D2_2 TaxID=3073092 RepID=UPI002815FF07|nr:hypothetical protein [Paenibacillus sp. D2_2]WMT41071.1 hypothetical protein RE628_29240 [Paenibacillus sp. D2_2]